MLFLHATTRQLWRCYCCHSYNVVCLHLHVHVHQNGCWNKMPHPSTNHNCSTMQGGGALIFTERNLDSFCHVWNTLSSSRGSQCLRKVPAVDTRSYTFLYLKMLSLCFPFRPKMRETITSSTRCWQVFPRSRGRLSISKRLRPTITSTR